MKFLDDEPEGEPLLLMTARQLSRLLSISERKLYAITFPRGTLRSMTLVDGGRPYYSRQTVVEWIASREAMQQNENAEGLTSLSVLLIEQRDPATAKTKGRK